MAVEPGEEHSLNAFGVEILSEFGVDQSEGLVQFAAGVGEAREVVEFVGSEKFGRAFFGAEMDESERGALGFDLRAKFG